MEKVKLTKQQAEAFEKWHNKTNVDYEVSKEKMLKVHCQYQWVNEYEVLNNLSVEQMAKALYIGYEVEKTPEDNLFESYIEYVEKERANKHNYELAEYFQGKHKGIKETLHILGITIKGIND